MTQQNISHIAQQNIAAELTNQAFFAHVREKFFSGSLKQEQVDGINTIVAECVAQGFTLPQIAYTLATAYHETARTMQPVREYCRGAGRKYGTWQTNRAGVKYCPKNGFGNTVYTQNECPHLFYGRGHVQLTWYDNYLHAGQKLGVDLIAQPELALQTDISAKIMILGMKEGWFTGKKLADYINDKRTDYIAARKIVNGTDKAEQIAAYAKIFERALNAV